MASESWIKLFVFCVHLSVVWRGDVIYVKLSQQKVVGAPRCSPRTGQNPIVLHTSPAWPGLGPGCMWPTAGKQLTLTNILWDNGLILWHGDTWHVTRGFRQPTLGKTQIMTQLRERETMPSTKSHPTSCLLFPRDGPEHDNVWSPDGWPPVTMRLSSNRNFSPLTKVVFRFTNFGFIALLISLCYHFELNFVHCIEIQHTIHM